MRSHIHWKSEVFVVPEMAGIRYTRHLIVFYPGPGFCFSLCSFTPKQALLCVPTTCGGRGRLAYIKDKSSIKVVPIRVTNVLFLELGLMGFATPTTSVDDLIGHDESTGQGRS